MELVFLPATGYPNAPNWRAVPVEVFGSTASLAMYLFARLSSARPQIKTDAGVAFMIANSLAIALLNAWAMPPSPLRFVSSPG